MSLYWFIFLLPAAFALQERAQIYSAKKNKPFPGIWLIIFLGLTLVIGLRHEVGGDWFNYLRNLERAYFERFTYEWWWDDPGYRLLEWIAIYTDWGIYGVNLISACFFSYGLVLFCRHQPRPWLALAVSVPYLVIILGMGYSRQGVALGCLMAGLVGLGRARVRTFLIWTLLGATFHKSALLLLPMAALAASKGRILTSLWVLLLVAMAYPLLIADSVESLKTGYLEAQYQSEGTFIRLLMNAVPALIFLYFRKKFDVTLSQGRLWFWFALGSLGLIAVYFITPSTTALDRAALYLLPIQLMVFSYLPQIMGKRHGNNQAWVLAVLAYYAMVEFVWLNFAAHAYAWLPYRWYPLEF